MLRRSPRALASLDNGSLRIWTRARRAGAPRHRLGRLWRQRGSWTGGSVEVGFGRAIWTDAAGAARARARPGSSVADGDGERKRALTNTSKPGANRCRGRRQTHRWLPEWRSPRRFARNTPAGRPDLPLGLVAFGQRGREKKRVLGAGNAAGSSCTFALYGRR